MNPNRPITALLLAFAVGAVDCGGTANPTLPGDGGGSGTGTTAAPLRIWVTDAPFPFDLVESASVVIREVRVRDRDRNRWETVFSGRREIDLAPLTNGTEELLVEASPDPGTYDEVRLLVDAGEVVLSPDAVVEDGNRVYNTENGRLHFPSGAQTGIKIGIENAIVVASQLASDLVLDFDLARNFVFNGPATHPAGVKRVLFTPSVRALNASTTGSISVTVYSDNVTPDDPGDDDPIQGATVRVRDDSGVVLVTAETAEDGSATTSVPPGDYSVELEAVGHESRTISDVSVVLANLTNLGVVVLAATGEIGGAVMSDAATADDGTDDVVVAGATVEIRAEGATGDPLATATTDANGVWRFDGLQAGAYDLLASAAGFEPGSLEGVPAAEVTPGYTITLVALTQDVSGTVTVPEGDDVTQIAVSARNSAGVIVADTAPAPDGGYSLTLATGSYEIAFDDGAAPQFFDVTLVGASPAPDPVTLDVTFEPPSGLTGTVRSDGGTPGDAADDVIVGGATVDLRAAGAPAGSDPLATTTTNAGGQWSFDGLTEGSYDVTVSASGYASGTHTGIAPSDTEYALTLHAFEQSVSGTVAVPEGTEVTAVSIEVRNADGQIVVTGASPDPDGTYRVTLATGTWTLVFTSGTSMQSFEVSLIGADPAPADHTLDVTFN